MTYMTHVKHGDEKKEMMTFEEFAWHVVQKDVLKRSWGWQRSWNDMAVKSLTKDEGFMKVDEGVVMAE